MTNKQPLPAQVAKSRDVEILEGRPVYLEFGGNIIPVLKSGEQLTMAFNAFRENRLTFTVKVRGNVSTADDTAAAADPHDSLLAMANGGGNGGCSLGRISFMNEPKVAKGEPPLQPLCTLSIALPERVVPMATDYDYDLGGSSGGLGGAGGLGGSVSSMSSPKPVLRAAVTRTQPSATVTAVATTAGLVATTTAAATPSAAPLAGPADDIHKADIRLSDICGLLGVDWPRLAVELEVPANDVRTIAAEFGGEGSAHQAMVMLRLWLRMKAHRATGNQLEQALHAIGRSDVVERCIFNLAPVTDELERATAKRQLGADGVQLEQTGLNGKRTASDPVAMVVEVLETGAAVQAEATIAGVASVTQPIGRCSGYSILLEHPTWMPF